VWLCSAQLVHLLKCNQILSDIQLKQQIMDISYSDAFGTLQQQVEAIKVWKMFLKFGRLSWKLQTRPPVDIRRTCSRTRVPHYLALLLRMWTPQSEIIVIAMFLTLDYNIYTCHPITAKFP
jgi:hypothetical protein